MTKAYDAAEQMGAAPAHAGGARAAYDDLPAPRWQTDDDWSGEDRKLLAELAEELKPRAAEIAKDWSARLAACMPARVRKEPGFVEAITGVNLWLFQQFLARLLDGDLARLFRESQRYNESLLRSQNQSESEFQSSMGQLIDSLEIMAGIVGAHIRRLYDDDARITALLSAFGRLALRLAHVAASTYHEKRSDALGRSLRIASALLHASRELQARASSADEIATRIAPIICASIACDRVAVFLWDRSERAYTLAAAHGFADRERLRLAAMRPTRAQYSGVEQALRDEPTQIASLEGLVPDDLLRDFDVGALCMAPMIATDSRVLGAIVALRRESQAFDEADTSILRGVGQNAARAIENVLLLEELASAEQRRREAAGSARDAERRRVARELHDCVLQDLTGVKLQLEGLVRRNPEVGLAGTIDSVIDLIAGLRRVVDDLRHPDFGGMSLRLAIAAHAEVLAERHGVELLLDLPNDVEVADWMTRDVYRIAQEAIANALRHAAPTHLVVQLYDDDDATVLLVEDDGCGFDRERFAVGGGVLGMRERAAALGADLHINSTPGEGTRVRLVLPTVHPIVSDSDA